MQYTVTHSKAPRRSSQPSKTSARLSLVFVRGSPCFSTQGGAVEVITNATASKKANEEDKQPDLASTPACLPPRVHRPLLLLLCVKRATKKFIHTFASQYSEPNIMQCAPHAHTVPFTAMRQSQLPLRDWSWQDGQRLLPKQTQSRR